jgi:hypothetical protein
MDSYGLNSHTMARDTAFALMDQPGGPPAVLPPAGGEVQEMIEMLIAMSNMMRFLMTDVVTGEMCERAEFLIKTFLSRVHKVNKALLDHLLDYVPIWIKHPILWGF